MKFILSPARRIKSVAGMPGTVPQFMPETMRLLERLKSYAPWELESLLKANPKLANDAFFDYLDFAADDGGTPALLAYDGLVFKNIDPAHLARPALDYADESMEDRCMGGWLMCRCITATRSYDSIGLIWNLQDTEWMGGGIQG